MTSTSTVEVIWNSAAHNFIVPRSFACFMNTENSPMIRFRGVSYNWTLAVWFPTKNSVCISPIHFFFLRLIDLIIFICRKVQIMGILVMKCSPDSRYFNSLGLKYSPRYPIPKHSKSIFFQKC